MKKLGLSFFSLLIISWSYGQSKFVSNVLLDEKSSDFEIYDEEEREFIFSDTKIVITNYSKVVHQLELNIDKAEEKEYQFKMAKWYFCSRNDKKYILIYTTDQIFLFNMFSEVERTLRIYSKI